MYQEYIHFGHKTFDEREYRPICNSPFSTKPVGGFWASPVDAPYGWAQWNADNHLVEINPENSFRFRLADHANTLHVHSVQDLKSLPKVDLPDFACLGWVLLDFETMLANGIDAIELHFSADHRLYNVLYTWDCDSILILNPAIIKPL